VSKKHFSSLENSQTQSGLRVTLQSGLCLPAI
jgi:hypothetical protein